MFVISRPLHIMFVIARSLFNMVRTSAFHFPFLSAQKKIAEIALQANGNHRGVPIKGTPRMVNKLKARDDHRIMPDFLKDHHGQKMTYRSGQNIDINRNAVTFQSVASMTHFIELLAAEFDGVARTKNMFAFRYTIHTYTRYGSCTISPSRALLLSIWHAINHPLRRMRTPSLSVWNARKCSCIIARS
jgi:hypothetical protein